MSRPLPFIRLEQVDKFWLASGRRIDILRGLNLEVYPGESLAITGPSGAGKSTLLHVLGLLTPIDSGRIWFQQKEVFRGNGRFLQALRRQIGLIFQDAKLLPELTVRENVCLPLAHRGVWPHRQKRLAEEALLRVGLGERLDHRPNQLSGGEMIRVSIARALVQQPPVLLADEPTGSLDSKTGNVVAEMLFKMVSPHRALVYVTHQESLARRADRMIFIKDGSIDVTT